MHCIKLVQRILERVSPKQVVGRSVRLQNKDLFLGDVRFELEGFPAIDVLGIGKAAAGQVEAFYRILLARTSIKVNPGLVVTKHGHALRSADFRCIEAGHPVPDQASLNAGREIQSYLKQISEGSLLIVCLSGGGSALAVLPRQPFRFGDKVKVFQALLSGGVPIREMNLIRREMSRIKNGGLVKFTRARAVVCLITSDIPGNELSLVSSGPCFREISSPDMERRVLKLGEKYLAGAVRDRFLKYIGSERRKKWNAGVRAAFSGRRVENVCISDSADLLSGAVSVLRESGFKTVHVMEKPMDEALETGVAVLLKQVVEMSDGSGLGTCLGSWAHVSGGELPVKPRRRKKGGSN